MKTMHTGLVVIGSIVAIAIGCSPEKETIVNEVVKVEMIDNEIPPPDNFNYDTLKGMYSGDFAGSEIRLILNYVSSTKAIGYNIHKGLQRNLNGRITRKGDTVLMSLPEPGDHEYDGVFELTFVGIDKTPKAKWVSNSGKISEKKMKLKKLEAPKDSKEGINSFNFSEFFYYVYDSIGNYSFEPDGLCIYKFYDQKDEANRVEQQVKVKGNWSLKGNVVTIDWEKNKVFPQQRMRLNIVQDEYEQYILKSEDRELHNYFY